MMSNTDHPAQCSRLRLVKMFSTGLTCEEELWSKRSAKPESVARQRFGASLAQQQSYRPPFTPIVGCAGDAFDFPWFGRAGCDMASPSIGHASLAESRLAGSKSFV